MKKTLRHSIILILLITLTTLPTFLLADTDVDNTASEIADAATEMVNEATSGVTGASKV